MLYTYPQLTKATFIKRYKRFFADCQIGDEMATAHCANTGKMMGLLNEGADVWLLPKTGGKLQWGWELTHQDGTMIGVNTAQPNRIVKEILNRQLLPAAAEYTHAKPEAKIGDSKLDFLLTGDGLPDCYIEVKNCHLVRKKGLLEFPDAVTTRGAKHLRQMANIAQSGGRAIQLYVAQRFDVESFKIADDLDPNYAKAAAEAKAAGVEFIAIKLQIDEAGVHDFIEIPCT